MSKAVQEWSDARLNDLAAALAPVPGQVAALTEAVENLDDVTTALQPLHSQVAALTATVERLTDENRALRDSLAATQRQLLQVAWGLVAALIGAATALISVLRCPAPARRRRAATPAVAAPCAPPPRRQRRAARLGRRARPAESRDAS